jgi:hypothetical protein
MYYVHVGPTSSQYLHVPGANMKERHKPLSLLSIRQVDNNVDLVKELAKPQNRIGKQCQVNGRILMIVFSRCLMISQLVYGRRTKPIQRFLGIGRYLISHHLTLSNGIVLKLCCCSVELVDLIFLTFSLMV